MIVNPEIDEYLKKINPKPHPVLEQMEEYGKQRNFPMVGPLVGRFLYALIEFGHVHTILECGSGFGYSAAWMALALPENSKIICIEYDEENISKAKEFLKELDVLHKVTFHKGNVLEIVPKLNQSYDLIFNDINKSQYIKIMPILIKKLRIGGILISDNVLWKGKVTEENPDDENTKYIKEFNKSLYGNESLWTSIIPLRDGLSLSIKLNI
jgi:predicted O-methyltransferase YrrM